MEDNELTGFFERLARAVTGRMVVPSLPPGAAARVPAADPPEMEHAAPIPAPEDGEAQPLGLFIRYVDAKGDQSERRITVRQLIGVPPEMILAFCHERRAPRNFRLDRIEEVAVAETGEVIALTALVPLLMQAGLDPIAPLLRRAINVLVFLLRCDGQAHPAEWEALDRVLAGFVLRFDLRDADHERAMRMARQVAPNADDFLIGMRSFTASDQAGRIGRWLLGAVREVTDADGALSEEEMYWLGEVYEFLNLMERKGRGA